MNNKTTTECAKKIGEQQTGAYLQLFLYRAPKKNYGVAGTIHSSKYMAILSAGILAAIFSIGAIDSFAQSELTTSTQDQGSNATSATTASLGEPLFVEQGRITGQRVLTVAPQPQLETSFMANTSINNGTGSVVNAINIGTNTITLNADGTFRGEGQGVLRTEGGDFASWTNQAVGNLAPGGNIIVRGVTFWSTPSPTTGELAFMNGVIGLFEMEIDIQGNLSVTEWQWEGEIGDVGAAAAASPPILQSESPINTTTTGTSSESSSTVMQ